MCKFTFKFSPFLFVFVLSGAKLLYLLEKDFAKCYTNIMKCNL